MDELEHCLRHIKNLKKDILNRLKGKEEQWQRLCVLLEFGTIDDSLREIPFEKKLRNATAIEFIYVQILFTLRLIRDRKVEKRKTTTAERAWKEREKVELQLWKKGKDIRLAKEMAYFRSYASVWKEYPHPFYSPSRDHMKSLKLTNRPLGRPGKDLRYFLGKTLNKPIRDLSVPCSHPTFSSFRSEVLEKLFQLIFG